jgi:cytochrome c oxidase assembly protein subunit 11
VSTVATAAARRNGRTAALMALVAAAMVGLAFASAPLYRVFCQVTGFDGTPGRAIGRQAPGVVAGKTVSVRFDGNVAPALPWKFGPEKTTQIVPIGGRQIAFFVARNLTARPITGRASFNVTPTQAARYFSKIQCFCFTEQTLQPGEEARMPVIFYVDPAFARDPDTKDVSEITLSYTFYPVDQPGRPG